MTNSNQHLVVTISIESIVCLHNNVTLLLLCDEPTCTQSYTYFCRHWSYRIGLQHICTVYSYSIQVHTVHIIHTVHIVQYTSTYCTYMHSIQLQYTGTYCTYSTVYKYILYIYVQYTGTYCTYSTLYRYILYIYVQYTGTYNICICILYIYVQ